MKYKRKSLGRKKVVLFPEIGRVKIFNFEKQTETKNPKKQEYKKAKQNNNNNNNNKKEKKKKKTTEETRISPENRLKNKFGAARVKIFLAIRISGKKSIEYFHCYFFNSKFCYVAFIILVCLFQLALITRNSSCL